MSFDEGSLVPAAAGAPHAPASGVAALTPQPPPTLMGGEQAVGLRYVRSKRVGVLKIDAEGADLAILQQVLAAPPFPRALLFEHKLRRWPLKLRRNEKSQ